MQNQLSEDTETMSAAEQVQIPEKLFYRINEVSTITQVKPYVLRYWETEFPMLSPEKDENDQRRYRKSDIELVLEIKHLLYTEKFTIAGARKQLRQGKSEPTPQPVAVSSAAASVSPAKARQLAGSINQIRQDIDELYRLLA
jgi:DNA-binding transcriptional MerR regulator